MGIVYEISSKNEFSPLCSNPQKDQLQYPLDLCTKFHRNRTSSLGDMAQTDGQTDRRTDRRTFKCSKARVYHSGILTTEAYRPRNPPFFLDWQLRCHREGFEVGPSK